MNQTNYIQTKPATIQMMERLYIDVWNILEEDITNFIIKPIFSDYVSKRKSKISLTKTKNKGYALDWHKEVSGILPQEPTPHKYTPHLKVLAAILGLIALTLKPALTIAICTIVYVLYKICTIPNTKTRAKIRTEAENLMIMNHYHFFAVPEELPKKHRSKFINPRYLFTVPKYAYKNKRTLDVGFNNELFDDGSYRAMNFTDHGIDDYSILNDPVCTRDARGIAMYYE